MSRTKTIFIIGFSGSGKSSVGKALAVKLGARFFDTDQMIVRRTGMTIRGIFARHGERFFRKLEREAIAKIVSGKQKAVVAVGGGAFQSKTNRKLMTGAGTVVYLSCAQNCLYQRLRHMSDRPLLHTAVGNSVVGSGTLRHRIKNLLNLRRPYYNMAHIKLCTSNCTVNQAVRKLVKRINEIDADHKR